MKISGDVCNEFNIQRKQVQPVYLSDRLYTIILNMELITHSTRYFYLLKILRCISYLVWQFWKK